MFEINRDQIFTFTKMPDWVSVNAIYFKVYDINKQTLKVQVFSESGNVIFKGERLEVAFSEEDMKKYEPKIIDDESKIAKILLME